MGINHSLCRHSRSLFQAIYVLGVNPQQHLPLLKDCKELVGVTGSHSLGVIPTPQRKVQVSSKLEEGARIFLEDLPIKELFWTRQAKILTACEYERTHG